MDRSLFHRNYRFCLIIWLSVITGSLCRAQFTKPIIIDDKLGLSSNNSTCVARDSQGFVWIGTSHGLNRFDGSEIISFIRSEKDSSILNDAVSDIAILGDKVWVAGPYGLSSVDQIDFAIRNFPFDCNGLLKEIPASDSKLPYVHQLHVEDNQIWMATRHCGLISFNSIDHSFRQYGFDHHIKDWEDGAFPHNINNIMSITPDIANDSILWVGTASGLIRLNKFSREEKRFYRLLDEKIEQDYHNVFRNLYMHPNGYLFFRTWRRGSFIFNTHTGEYFKLPVHKDDESYFSKSLAYRFHFADLKHVWLEATGYILLYSLDDFRVKKAFPMPKGTLGFENLAWLVPTEKTWVTSLNGVIYFDPLQEQMHSFNYSHLLDDDMYGFARKVRVSPDSASLYIFPQGADGIFEYNLAENQWSRIRMPSSIRTENRQIIAVDVAEHPNGQWVVSTELDLFFFDPVHRAIKRINLPESMERPVFQDVEVDSSGGIWIGTWNEGLIYYDPEHFKSVKYTQEIFGKSNSERAMTQKLFLDSQGNIWFSTLSGHGTFNRRDSIFHIFSYRNTPDRTALEIANFVEKKDGTIMALSSRGGIYQGSASESEMGLRLYYHLGSDSLFRSYYNGMILDRNENLWVLSDHYLLRIDSALKHSVFRFDYTTFDREFFCFDVLPNDQFAIGLRGGTAIVTPDNLQVNTQLPLPYITEVKINDRVLGGNHMKSKLRLDLKHHENYLSFSFSSIAFTHPQQNIFRYRLDGIDPEWIVAGKRRFVNYTNLPSGDYTFQLQAANNEGLWNPEVLEIPVSIATPWWETWWFKTLLILGLAGVAYAGYSYRIAAIRKEARLKSEFQKKLADVELAALRAQMNPHFIFNCLNSIESYIIKNETFKAAEYINDFARLMRLILQNSRSELISLSDEIEALDLYLQMESLRFDNQFQYYIKVGEEVNQNEMEIPPMLIQPFVENAIWHGLIPKKGSGLLNIEMKRSNGVLKIVIEDNGIGRKRAEELNASMKKRGKRSMGMLITQSRMEVISELYNTHATVAINDLTDEDGNPAGTRVDLEIPIE